MVYRVSELDTRPTESRRAGAALRMLALFVRPRGECVKPFVMGVLAGVVVTATVVAYLLGWEANRIDDETD